MYPTNLVEWQAYAHENPDHWLGRNDGNPSDTILSLLGSELGQGLDEGTIKPAEVGDWMRSHLGDQ